MEEALFVMRSVTGAQRGAAALRRGGIFCRVGRTPRALAAGCGYCLYLAAPDAPEAARLLRQAGIPVQGRYRRGPGGSWEEKL